MSESIPSKLSDNLFKLEFLSLLKRNQKICMYDYSIVDSKSILGSLKRSFRNETRESNVNEIRIIVSESYSLIIDYRETKYYPLIMEKLIKAKSGITNLLTTYQDDPKIIGLLNIILDELTLQIEKQTISE